MTGAVDALPSDLEGGLCYAVRRYQLQGRSEAGRLPVVAYRENGVEAPPMKAKLPKTADISTARDELARLWRSLPWGRPALLPAGSALAAAVRQANLGSGFSTGLDEQLAVAWAAVEALRIAEPRISPWLAVSERLLRRWATKFQAGDSAAAGATLRPCAGDTRSR